MLLKNPLLRRYWFSTGPYFGFGVTAYSLEDAENLLDEAGLLHNSFNRIESVVEDIDLQTIEVICRKYSIGPPNFRGVWRPFLNLQAPYK
jgi:hypothetical protein